MASTAVAADQPTADPTATLTSLLTRLRALPPSHPSHATAPNSKSLATTLPSLIQQLERLSSSSAAAAASQQQQLHSSLHATLSNLLQFTPAAEQQEQDLIKLAWDCVRGVVEWVVLRELAPREEENEGDGRRRREWEKCLRGVLLGVEDHLERTEEEDPSGGAKKDQPYRTLVSSILSPTLVNLIVPAPAQGWTKEIIESIPDLARYAALEIFNDLLSKHAPNKALARQLLPAASLGALLRSSTDFHLSQAAMEIAYRAVPPFNPRSHSATTTSTTSNPKKVWIEQLFPVELFGTDAEMFRQRFYALKGGNYYEEMPEILKLISMANVERSQPFMLHSLVYNTTRVLISPSTAETDIWICHHSIAGLFNIPNEEGDYYDERFYLPLSDVRAIEIENGPQGDEDSIVIELILNAPPHLGNLPLEDQANDSEKEKLKLVMKTTRRGNAFDALHRTMEERAIRYPALTPHLTSSGTSTSSRPTILHPPPPGAQPQPLPAAIKQSKKPRSSQAGPIIGFFKDPVPAAKAQSVNGDLETPVFERKEEEESQTMRRGKVLAELAELKEGSEVGSEEGEGEGVEELVSGQVVREVREEEEEEGGEREGQQGGQAEVDPGELSSDLSSIEESDDEAVEVKVKINSRQPSKKSTTSNRKPTTTSSRRSTSTKSLHLSLGSPPSPIPLKRRSPRLSPKPKSISKKKPQHQAPDPTDSIEEESLVKKPVVVVDEIVEDESESMPKAHQQQQVEAPHPSSHEVPSNAEKEKEIPLGRPRRGAPTSTSKSEPKEVVVAIPAEPAAVPLKTKPKPKTKRARSPSPAPLAASPTPPPRPKIKLTITDQPPYPKRRKITDPSPVDEGAPYETTLETEEGKKSSGGYTLQEKKKSGVQSPRRKYGRERKERKVTEGVKVTRVGRGKGKKVEEEEKKESEQEEEEESEEEEAVSVTKGRKNVEAKKPATDFDSLPHVKSKPAKKEVKSTTKTKTKTKAKANGKEGPPISASTTKSAASRSTRGAVKKDAGAAAVSKKAGAKSKKAQTFSQLVATPPPASPHHSSRSTSPLPAPRPISQIDESDSQQQQPEKVDVDFGFGRDPSPRRPSPPVDHRSPTPVTDGIQQPRVEDGQKSTGSLPMDPALDPSFVKNALGELQQGEPHVAAVKEAVQHQEEEPQQKEAEQVEGRAEQVEKESLAPQDEVEEEQPAQVVEDGPKAMEVDEQPPPAQPREVRASRSPSLPAQEETEQQGEELPEGLRLGYHVLGPTPAQPAPQYEEQEQPQDFAIAEEEPIVELHTESAGEEESAQALEADVESAAEMEMETRSADGDEMVVDGAGEDSGFFAVEDEEAVAAQEQQQLDAAKPIELVPNTSSLPQASFEHPSRPQPAARANPTLQRSPQLSKSSDLLPRRSPVPAKSNPPRPPRISLLANQLKPNNGGVGGVFSSPRAAPKALAPPRPRRRASSEPPSGQRDGAEGSPRARARSHGRHSEPEPKRAKEKQAKSKSKTANRRKSGRASKGKERERVVYSDEEEPEGDGVEQDFEQELRAQLDDMVNYIVLKAQARRLASAQAFEASKRRIKKQFAKGADAMHENTVAVAVSTREQVEQLKSTPVKFAALRDRQREFNKAREPELVQT